jgi:phosphoglycerol transferase
MAGADLWRGRMRWPTKSVRDRRPDGRTAWIDAAFYAAAALMPVAVIGVLMRVWDVGLSAPFYYGGDELGAQAGIKGLLETGSLYTNPALGAPGVAKFYDYPSSDWLNVLLVRFFGLFGGDTAVTINLFYLSGYAAIGVTTAYLMRRMGLSRLVSLLVAVLYAVLPYHYMRSENHLFLSMYWIIPLIVLVLLWFESPQPPLFRSPDDGRFPFRFGNGRSVAAIVIFAAAGASGVYYLFFGCFFLVFAGIRAAVRGRSYRPAAGAALLIVVTGVVFALQMAPGLIYSSRHGKSSEVAVRSPYEAETYGLRITQMFLPIDGHRIQRLAEKRAGYRIASYAGGTEANVAALGALGALGFLLAVSALVLGWPRARSPGTEATGSSQPADPRWLGALAVSAVLLGTVAGFGAVFASVVSPEIRSYNRISVFISLFAFATLGLLADRFIARRDGRRWRVVSAAVVVAIAALGLLDQTPSNLYSSVADAHARYTADAAFGQQVQSAFPGKTVFQLPYLAYPESPPIYGMQDQDPFKGYLHTSGMRWSYGATKGRPDAAWQQATAALPVPKMLKELRAAGFDATWVQLNGYEDNGAAISRSLTAELGKPVVVSSDGLIAVWAL